MSRKYSDFLPSFGRNRQRDEEKGVARFDHFHRNARIRRQGPRTRVSMKVIGLAAVIVIIAWGASERSTLFSMLGSRQARIRTIVPLAVTMGQGNLPEYSSELLQQRITEVTPAARACLMAWPEVQRNQSGQIEVEVVLGKGGAVEAAVYGQLDLPASVGRCVGEALGSRRWPQPPWNRRVRFPVVGGALR